MKLQLNILLTQNEKLVFDKIQSYAISKRITPRVAGGWVRDKLLGINTNDIDITLDKISGFEFANNLRTFHGWTGSINKIKANPDKSKHLETAVMKIYGISVDFLSLRKEEYTDSRIPKIISCSAKEDAFRRDLTINSLFYNLVTEKIEDFTNKGINDLKNKIIRTPLDPFQTLCDDPLRLLRIIRFSIRYDFQINKDLKESFKSEIIKNYLQKKVSPERIRTEIFKILELEKFINAFKIFISSGLIKIIFKIESEIHISDLLRIHLNYTNFKKHLNLNNIIIKLYVLLIFDANNSIDENNKNYILIKNIFCANKKIFSAIKQIEKNISLLKKVNEKMSDFDAIFLLRHMKENFKDSIVIYLMKGFYECTEISDFFKGINRDKFNKLICESHSPNKFDGGSIKNNFEDKNEFKGKNKFEGKSINWRQESKKNNFEGKNNLENNIENIESESINSRQETKKNNLENIEDKNEFEGENNLKNIFDNFKIKSEQVNSTDQNLENSENDCSIDDSLKKNKYLILHLLNIAKKYENSLFPASFPFDGKKITKIMKIKNNEISFYLEIAKVEYILNKISLEELPFFLENVRKSNRIKRFEDFYLTKRF